MTVRPPQALSVPIDNGDAQRRLVDANHPLHIPKRSVQRTAREEPKRDHTGEEVEGGWANQERILGEQGGIRQRGKQAWQQFSGGDAGDEPNFGSVQIDAPVVKLSDLKPPAPPSDRRMTGWQRLDHWHEEAAKLEEWGRENADQLESSAVLTSVVSRSGRRRGGDPKKRRRFQVVTPT